MQDETSSSEGVQIHFVTLNYGPHQYSMCSPQGHSPVTVRHTFLSCAARIFSRMVVAALLVLTAGVALAQTPQTIDVIRVIGNRRIPKETIVARLFTHPGDTYDPASI